MSMYVTRLGKAPKFILPVGSSLYDDEMYVAYDVYHGDNVIIPKSTFVIGNWISKDPGILQLQLTRIYLGQWYSFEAYSNWFDKLSFVKDFDNDVMYHYPEEKNVSTVNRSGEYYHTVIATNVKCMIVKFP